MDKSTYYKGRGAQLNTSNRFLSHHYEADEEVALIGEYLPPPKVKTQFITEHAKKVVNFIESPDMYGMRYVNPYQGCEHGCIYCYARNSHEYWGFSAGLDFESKIMVKKNAPSLVEKAFQSKKWEGTPLSLAGNTDCYQPAEKIFRLTRSILEVCLRYRNPVGILTKNALVLRDLDVLVQLAQLNLVHVFVSITTLNEPLRLVMEPRTVTASQRLKVLSKLTQAGIPTGIMTAPIIPGLTDHEIPAMIQAGAEAGALTAGYTVVRLNGSIATIFEDWIRKNFPDRADKVLNQIKACHGGQLNDSRFGVRMKGEGVYAEHIAQLHRMARHKYMNGRKLPPFDTSLFMRNGQLNLF
ncbi:MAG: PA0069 family radical SAM protein [Spirosomataceae bacterium]